MLTATQRKKTCYYKQLDTQTLQYLIDKLRLVFFSFFKILITNSSSVCHEIWVFHEILKQISLKAKLHNKLIAS